MAFGKIASKVLSAGCKAAVALCLTTPVIAEEITIAALGDSLTQGYGLLPEHGFVAQLDVWLETQSADVKLINAGVSGDTTAGGKSRIDWTLTDGVDGLIVALGGNDVLRGIDPDVSRANLDAILGAATGKGVAVLLVGIPAPSNYGADYQTRFDAIYPDLAKEYGAILYPDFLTALRQNGGSGMAELSLMQADNLHPNPEGVTRMVAGIGPSVLALIDAAKGG